MNFLKCERMSNINNIRYSNIHAKAHTHKKKTNVFYAFKLYKVFIHDWEQEIKNITTTYIYRWPGCEKKYEHFKMSAFSITKKIFKILYTHMCAIYSKSIEY